MRASRVRTLQVLSCFACAGLALRPVRPVDQALDALLVTSRPLAGLAAPLSGLRVVRAENSGFTGGAVSAELHAAELAERDALEWAVRRSAEPSRDLGDEVIPVHAEVVGRPRGSMDVLEIRVDQVGLVQVGLPVVAGDVYVGTVSEVSLGLRSGAEVEFVKVQLVTGRHARVGAAVIDEESGQERARAVVGGLLRAEDFGLPSTSQVLCVHYPSLRSLRGGQLVVSDPEASSALASDHNHLANGFQLGRLVSSDDPDERTRERLLGAEAQLDYATGLYQVLVLTRPRGREAPPAEERPRWARASLALRADPGLGRDGRKLLRGSWGGVQPGSTLAAGLRLYGRVERVGPWTADVRTLGDPGLAFPALAVLSEDGGPGLEVHVLGRLVGRGRDAEGRPLFTWSASLPLEGERPRPARIWTGSGEAGLDRGLLVGDTWLPVGPGPHELVITPPAGSTEPAGLRVRLRDEVSGGGQP